MAELKKKTSSLVITLISIIGVGVAVLTFVQVFVLSGIARTYSREENVDNYVRWVDSVDDSLSQTVEGYYKDLYVYVGADVMESGNVDLAGEWLNNNQNLRSKEFDYIMIAGPDGFGKTHGHF